MVIEHSWNDFSTFKFIEAVLWNNICSLLENVPCLLEKNGYSAIWGVMFYRCVLSLVVYVVMKSSNSLLIICLVVLSLK